MPTFKVWLATDTLLYLPVYALADFGIAARVAGAAELTGEVRIEIMPAPLKGDRGTIEHMLRMAEEHPDEIHIAIADPVAVFRADPKGAQTILLGAFLKRPPFWVVGRDLPSKDIKVPHRYVYYDQSFTTGNILGQQISTDAPEDHVAWCKMGEEFSFFDQPEEIVGELRVVTADLWGLVAAQARDPSIRIQRRLMLEDEFQDFLTTGILSSRLHQDRQADGLAIFMEAIRSSCVLLRTAEQPAAALIRQLIERGIEFKPALTGVARPTLEPGTAATEIAARLFQDGVYSDTLAVEFAEWRGAIHARSWRSEEKKAATSIFYRIYEPRHATYLTAEWLVRTFRDYGRFVEEARILKGGVAGGLAALLVSQLLMWGFERQATLHGDSSRALESLAIGSAVLALGAVIWAVLGLLMNWTRLLRPIQRLLSMDENATRAIVTGITAVLISAALLFVATSVFHVPIAPDAVILHLTPLGVGIAAALLQIWRSQRHA
jgi:hypothetical protein